MNRLVSIVVIALLAPGLVACGNKGKLKSPAQIEANEAKKARKKAKQEASTPKSITGEAIPPKVEEDATQQQGTPPGDSK